jgi:hypothetical protein
LEDEGTDALVAQQGLPETRDIWPYVRTRHRAIVRSADIEHAGSVIQGLTSEFKSFVHVSRAIRIDVAAQHCIVAFEVRRFRIVELARVSGELNVG